MGAILFRPVVDSDLTDWVPVLNEVFKGRDFRVWPDVGNVQEIHYLISWKLHDGDAGSYPNLKAVLALGAGVNQYIGHPEMPRGSQLVRMIDPLLDRGMAEYIASYVLRFHRDHDMLDACAVKKEWHDYTPLLAAQRRVGFMGLGKMVQAAIDLLRPFGFQIKGWSRTQKEIDGADCSAGPQGLKNFLAQTDILVCLLPLTTETENILNHKTLSLLPRGSFLINAGRGKHLVEEDLIPLLESGHIARAALDVFRKEPLESDHPFWTHPKIHVTPHVAAVTFPHSGSQALLKTIVDIESGRMPEGLVDFKRGY